ncbi:hypothetical protein WA026_006898 [Henosepilachna vigintioctopunctata]|uniref:Antigen KI-67 n=1 Tax=Henosepilachna vigintioctopunctata TaxID=420089 RepID=A0AAW1V7Z6_9CUCU
MANNLIGNNCGCLYFYSKKGLSQPFYLTRGKTTIGSDFQCNIRIKGIENIFCNLDSNEAGFTVLVNSNEDERVLLNGVYAQKYSVLSHDDHFQLGDKKFKYCKPDINEKALECFRKVVATKMLVGNLKSESKRKSTGVYSLKRLQNSSSRRFSTGTRISEIKFLSGVPEKNLPLAKTSTPQSASKTRLSQKISRPRHSALGVLKENETFEFQINSRKSNSSTKEDLIKLDDTSKAEFKAPTPKKSMLSTGNLKELDINSTVSSCCTPIPTRKKMYSAATITPLNVSKKKVNINKSLLTYAESSTPKSALRRQRSSSMYRPIVEEVTPVSPLPRSSLRISSLKKPSFTQRRSVNFNISSNSDCSLIHSDLVENVSLKLGSKRKRCLSDISGSAEKKKITENSEKSEDILAFSLGDSEDDIVEPKDTEVLKCEGKETTPKQEISLSLTTSVGYDSDLEDICISLAYKDTSGRQYIDNSCLATPEQSISPGRYNGRRTSIHKHRKSNAYSAKNELAETSKSSRVNSSKVTIDSTFEAGDDETPSSDDGEVSPRTTRSDKMNSFVSSVGKSSRPRRSNVTLPLSATKLPKKSIVGNYAKTTRSEGRDSSSEERPRNEITFNSSVVSDKKDLPSSPNFSRKESRSPNGICDENDYSAMSDSLNMSLNASDASTRSGRVSRSSSILDKKSYLENSAEKSLIASKFTGRTSTPVESNRFRTSKSSSGTANDFPSFRRRPNIRSNSLNLRCQTRSSINKTRDNSLLMRHLKRRFSVDQSLKSPIVLLRNSSIVSTPPSAASISTRATIGSRKSSSESLSGNSSSKHTEEVSIETTRRSKRNSTNISGRLDISPRKSSAAIRTPTTTPKNTSKKACEQTLDESLKKIFDVTETSNFILESDDSLSGVSLENTNKSFSNTQKSSAVNTPVSALSKTSNSIIYSFVNSSFDGSLQESVATRRSSRLTRPSIDESIYEISKLNANSQKCNNDKSVTNRRIREWIQSPTVSKSPDTCLDKGDDDVFQSSHEKDPTDIKITEAVFSKYLDSPKETAKAEKNISANYETGSDPTDITTLRRLLRTPRKSTASKNDATTVHSAGKFQVSTTQNNQSAIIDNYSTTNTSFAGDASAEKLTTQKSSILSGNVTFNTKENVKCLGSEMQNSPRNDLSQISSIKKLKVTPKIQNSPKNDLTNIAGIKKMLTTPKIQKSPKNDLSYIAGIKKLMATPKIKNSPKNDLTNIAGIKKMLKTPKKQKSPRNDLTNIAGIKKLMVTPKDHKSPKNDLTNVAGIKRILRTPKVQKSPKNDLTQVVGVKKLMTTPKEQKSPNNDLTNVAGVKQLLQSPRIQKSPRNDLSQVAGVKKLMATPKIQNSPKNDLTQVAGVKKLMATPKVQRSPKNDLTHVAGVKKLMATPTVQNSPVNDLTNVSGITEMLKTPMERRSAKKNSNNISGVKKLSKTPSKQSSNNDLTDNVRLKKLITTPKQPRSPEKDFSDLRGVKQLLRTPKVKSKSNDDDVFNTINELELSGIGRLFNESNDSTFDKLLDKKPLRTYIKSPKKQNRSNENCIGLDSPAENISSKNSNARNLVVNYSTRSGNGLKQLYDSDKESISALDINASETPTVACSLSETKTPSKNDASGFIRLLESSRSKRGEKNPHVPTVELELKVTSTPLSIQYENENNISTEIESNKSRRKANNKRKHLESDTEKPKKSKICKSKDATSHTHLEIDESKLTNTPLNKVSTDDGNHIDIVANSSFKQGPKVLEKSTRSKKILIQEGTENEMKKSQIEGKMQSKSTRRNDPDILKESNEDLSENKAIAGNRRKKNVVKENSEDSRTGVEKSNELKKEDAFEVTDYSSGNNLRTRTRNGHKELGKDSINETDLQNVSVESNITTKRTLRKVTERAESGTKNTEKEAPNTKTRRGRKKIENDSELDSETRKEKDEIEINAYVKQNSIVDEKIESTAREKEGIKLADKKSNTQKVKKKMKINQIGETEAHNSSSDINLKTRTRSRRVKGIGIDNEEISITKNVSENLSTKTRTVKKKDSENKTDEIGTCSDPSENSFRTTRGKNNVKDSEETIEVDVSREVVQSKTRRGKRETKQDSIDQTKKNYDSLEQNSKTRGGKDTIQAKLESSVSDVDDSKKMKIRTRGNTRNNKNTQSNNTTQDPNDHYEDQSANDNLNTQVENENREPGSLNPKKSSKKENLKPEKDSPNVTARNTRANRGQNRKYDEIEWHTPLKSPSKKIKKNVTFDKNIESNTPINNSSMRMTRSRRAKK